MVDFFPEEELLAAIDLGSNSFHLAIARLDHGEIRKVASMSEKVQLAAGLDSEKMLSLEAQQRGLDCLSRFAGRLGSVMPQRLRIVATNSLREAANAQDFIDKAQKILPKSIEIIAGREEARLIYLGVSHTMPAGGRRLVVDIGGGSTEFIIGQGFEPLQTESLQMGCVAFTRQFFVDGLISEAAFEHAKTAARQEVNAIAAIYRETGWDTVVGSSGTIKAARQLVMQHGLSDEQGYITYDALMILRKQILACHHINDIDIEGLKEDRKAILPAGLAILMGLFEVLGIERMGYSEGALREGVMYDLLGRFRHEDVRDRSVQALMTRYYADSRQAERVAMTARQLFLQVADALSLDEEAGDFLRRAAYLHEIGLAISHGSYHRHGAYLLEHSDLPGFSKLDQLRLSFLVGLHRRKLRAESLEWIKDAGGSSLATLCLLLRLAVLFHHSRYDQVIPNIVLSVQSAKSWQLLVDQSGAEWPMLQADLTIEITQFANWGIQLDVIQWVAETTKT
jgi:exopolyphosphatase / guanosine-5'-triphosphate,3'-diphosphate pyrophosphatase